MSQTVTPVDSLVTFTGEQPGATRIYDNAQVRCSGVSLSAIKMELWNTIEDFALRSTAWRLTLNWTMGIGTSSIGFNPIDENTLVCNVMAVTGLTDYIVEPPALLVDRRAPTAVRIGRAIVATKPSSFAADMPNDLFSNRFEPMLDGTLYRLYSQPAKPWTSAKSAEYHGRRYSSAINAAQAAVSGAHSNQGGWRYPYFAAGRRTY